MQRIHRNGAAVAVLAGLAVSVWACSDADLPTNPRLTPTEPESRTTQEAAQGTQPQGCATLRVELTGRTGIHVTPSDDGCGDLRVALAGEPTHDRVAGTVRVPLSIDRAGGGPARTPALLALWPDELRVISPPGLARGAGGGTHVAAVNPDSAVAADAETWPGAWVWRAADEAPSDALPAGVEQRFGGVVLDLRVHDGVLVFEVPVELRAEPAGIPVPDEAPEEYPADLYDRFDDEWQVPLDVVAVIFTDVATAAEKSAAAGLAGGVAVIGGTRLPPGLGMDGIYLIRIETDGTIDPLLRAVERLRALPQVVTALMFSRLAGEWERPQDGSDFRDWQLHPDSADGQNWAQELIAGPLAWGCTVGDAAAPVGVLDTEFAPVADLAPNLANAITSSGERSHGTRVASIVAARGNNGAGMTGMMWQAGLRLYDFQQPGADPNASVSIIHRIGLAVQNGTRVINMSQGFYWQAIHQRLPNVSSSDDSTRVLNVYHAFRDFLSFVERRMGPESVPLLVVPAGNDGIDAFWNSTPNLVHDFPDHVLVVGGTRRMRPRADGTLDLWAGSSRGPLLDVTAPAEDVYSLDRGGSVTPATGTSYAAPFVTGTAGLLLSFDPSIPTADLKRTIVVGATNGGRTSGGVPLLNAYEALKLAAQRDGAPLCGNRLASDGTDLQVQRASGWRPLLELNGDWGRLNVLHGGRTLDAYLTDTETNESHRDRFQLQSGQWTRTGSAANVDYYGAREGSIYNSAGGASHSGDTTAVIRQVGGNSHMFTIRVFRTTRYSTVYHEHVIEEPFSFESSTHCNHRFGYIGPGQYVCRNTATIYNGDVIGAGVAWVPQGGKLIVWFRRGTRTMSLGGWGGCGEDMHCRGHDAHEEWYRTDFYEMDVQTGGRRALFSVPYSAEGVAVSEDGREIMIARVHTEWTNRIWWVVKLNQWGLYYPYPESTVYQEDSQCAVEWRRYETGDVVATAPLEKTCRILDYQPSGWTSTIDWFLGTMAP